MKLTRIYGAICIVFGVIFAHLETIRFGSNMWPETNEELLCDIASLLLVIAGSILIHKR